MLGVKLLRPNRINFLLFAWIFNVVFRSDAQEQRALCQRTSYLGWWWNWKANSTK